MKVFIKNEIENLKNYEFIKKDIEAGENVLVITKWIFEINPKIGDIINPFLDCYFFEKETEKAVILKDELKINTIYIPKSQILYLEKNSTEITKLYIAKK